MGERGGQNKCRRSSRTKPEDENDPQADSV